MAQAPQFDWYLADWLKTLRVKQAKLMELADWDKRKTSELVNGKQRYNRDIVNEAAAALNLQPYELLMHPQDAMEIRQLRQSIALAAQRRGDYDPRPESGSNTDPAETPTRKRNAG